MLNRKILPELQNWAFFAILERFMANDTNTQIDPPMPPAVLSGAALYDAIMGQIEPELVSANLPFAADAFAQETAEQRAERARRYQAAFDEYDRRFEMHITQWDEQLRTYKRHAMSYIEGQARGEDNNEIASIESSIISDV
jgi:hypothetical protein